MAGNKKSEYYGQMEIFKKAARKMSQDELLDMMGYMMLRTAELEALFLVLKEKKVITTKDFDKYKTKLVSKSKKMFKELDKRKSFGF